MTHLKLATKSMEISDSQNATQIAYEDVSDVQTASQHANGVAGLLENSVARLADATEFLEMMMEEEKLCVDSADDVGEALALIIEAQRLLAATYARAC